MESSKPLPVTLVFLGVLLLGASPSRAQSAAPPASAQAPAPPRAATFRIEDTASGSSLRIRGLAQLDGVFFPGAATPADAFLLKRARARFDGTFFRSFQYQFQSDFRNNAVEVLDAWVEARPSAALRVRMGKAKAPVSLERLQSAPDIAFYERSYPTQLAPNRDIGVQVLGDVPGGVAYALGVFDGTPDGASIIGNTDDHLEVAGRVFVQLGRSAGSPLQGLGLGAALSRGTATGTSSNTGLSSYKTTGGATAFRYADAAIADGARERLDFHGQYYRGRLGVLAEWIRSSQEIGLRGETTSVSHTAWNAHATVALTDDRPAYTGLVPRTTFSRATGTSGAVELVARVEALTFDRDAFAAGLANPANSVRRLLAWTVGVNWYLNPNVRIIGNFEDTRADGGAPDGDRPTEHAVVTRLQLAF